MCIEKNPTKMNYRVSQVKATPITKLPILRLSLTLQHKIILVFLFNYCLSVSTIRSKKNYCLSVFFSFSNWAYGKCFFYHQSFKTIRILKVLSLLLCNVLCEFSVLFLSFIYLFICSNFSFGWWESRGKGVEHTDFFPGFWLFVL